MKDPIQEQLALARRNQILDAAGKVFAEKGFHQATIKDIATEAGIADGTIYLYFDNKSALLPGVFERMRETVRHQTDFAAPAEGDLSAVIRTIIRQPMMALSSNNFELFRVVVSEMAGNEELRTLYRREVLEPTVTMAEQYLDHLAAQGLIKPSNHAVVVRALSGMVLGLALQVIMGDDLLEASWDNLADELSELILDGLRSSE